MLKLELTYWETEHNFGTLNTNGRILWLERAREMQSVPRECKKYETENLSNT